MKSAVSHNVNWFRNRKLFQPFLVENVVRLVSRYLSSNEIYTRPVVKCQKITAAVAHCFRPSSKLVENVDRFNQPKIGFLQGNTMTKIQMKPFSSSFLWCRLLCCKKVFLIFESVTKIPKCDHSNESYGAVLYCGIVYCAVPGGFINTSFFVGSTSSGSSSPFFFRVSNGKFFGLSMSSHSD